MKLVVIGPAMLARPRYFNSIDSLRDYLWGKSSADYEVFVMVPGSADLPETLFRVAAAERAGAPGGEVPTEESGP